MNLRSWSPLLLVGPEPLDLCAQLAQLAPHLREAVEHRRVPGPRHVRPGGRAGHPAPRLDVVRDAGLRRDLHPIADADVPDEPRLAPGDDAHAELRRAGDADLR